MARKQAPLHLQPATRRWWAKVAAEYQLEPHHLHLLTLAAESLDRSEDARKQVAQEGLTVQDRFGQTKAHPACAVERDAKSTFARLLRELDLDAEPAPQEARPPMLRRYA